MRQYDVYTSKLGKPRRNAIGLMEPRLGKPHHELVRSKSIASVKAETKKKNPNSLVLVYVHYPPMRRAEGRRG